MKQILAFLTIISLLSSALPAFAATNVATQIFIRGNEASTIYWVGNDGKRYVFPNYTTYRSWFITPENDEPLLPSVSTLTDAELATYPLAGIVRERPGMRMVKIQTDPKVYAIMAGGFLQWIPTEAMAQALYGPDWNKKIDDVPVEFFTGYTIIEPVNCGISGDTCTDPQVMSYSPQNEIGHVTNPDDDLRFRESYHPSESQTGPYTGPQD